MHTRITCLCLLASLLNFLPHLHGEDHVLITEFMALNDGPLLDEDGDPSDWIELHNAGTNIVNLDGWFLTDRSSQLSQWRFPATNLAPNAYLIVFASGKDRRVPGAPLHTAFRLNGNGEFLGLVRPGGTNVASAFTPVYPVQASGVSYGIPVQQTVTALVTSGTPARVVVPWDGSFGTAWAGPIFDDSGWLTLLTGVGFETDGRTPFVPVPLADSAADFSGVQGANNWFYGYWNKGLDADGVYSENEFESFPNDGGPHGPGNFWTGSQWDWFNGNPPDTELTSQGGRPSGDDGQPGRPNHWAIRRYICETNGPITIRATLLHTSDWVYVTQTGIAANSLLYIYQTGVGEGYLDDIKLVQGTTPEAGPNLMPNGDFEGGSLTPWTVSANLASSALSTTIRHSGSASLRLVSTSGGSSQGSSIWQTISPALTAGQTYTLSYWYLPATNSSPLVVRFSGSWINTEPDYCGDGVVGRVFVDGVPVHEETAFISRADFSITVPAQTGSRVDLVLDAGPAGDGACDGAAFNATISTADPTLAVVADSVADWSVNGTQGEKNWFYGYFDGSTNLPPTYNASNFVAFPHAAGPQGPGNFWDGASWDWWNGNPPFDEIGQSVMNPSGYNNGYVHWVIRRWISEVSGSLTVDWTVNKLEADGAGVTVRVLQNGVQRDSLTLPGTNAFVVARSVTLPNVQVGDRIDVALDPQGQAGGYGDGGDRCLVTAVIRGKPSLTSLIASDVETLMRSNNASIYLRIPFEVSNPALIQFLTLRMKFDDGFAAYLNGVLVASANAPGALDWNSAATAARTDAEAGEFREFNLTPLRGLLQPGTNVLAIHGLNFSATDSDFLVLPELLATSVALDPGAQRYFAVPTPGAANGYGQTNLGPLILSATHTPNVPYDFDALRVNAVVRPTFQPVGTVSLVYRVMFSNEVTLPMFDDGLHGDGPAGDGVFAASIPASASRPGQMVRYYIYAADTSSNAARFPAFEDPQNSPAYQGTVVRDLTLINPLPVLFMFVQNPTLTTNEAGTRCSLFWDEEFYDNVGVNLHGQTTPHVFSKRGMDIDMNPGHQFRWRRGEKRADDFNLLTTAPDKAFFRHVLAYETFQNAEAPGHFAFNVRLQQNGGFNGIFHLVENGDADFLERIGYDPNGALYKVYLPVTNAYGGVVEKKTRKNENNADLEALIAGAKLSGTPLRQFLYDNIDIPEVINFLATINLVANEDCCWYKNYYFYRDTQRTGEWQILPWDVDLTFGRTFTPWSTEYGYYDPRLFITNRWFVQTVSDKNFIGNGNLIADALWSLPEGFEMFLRRWSTVHEELLQPPNAHPLSLKFERRADEFLAQNAPDATLDLAQWGTWSPTQTIAQAIGALKTQYWTGRRQWIFQTLNQTNNGPYRGSQPTNSVLLFATIEFNPASGNQDQEFIQFTNPHNYAVDVSGWKLSGAVTHKFRGGTVVPAHGTLYLSPNVVAFRARGLPPRGGQGLFVQGDYQGRLSARGEGLQLVNRSGQTMAATNYAGAPSLAQQYLRITELMYHPELPPPGLATNADEFEYVELKNVGPVEVSLVGVHFSAGIEFTFTADAAVTNLAPGATVLVARNPSAFVSRYGNGLPVVGPYVGGLDNSGETVRLDDALGEKIVEVTYNNSWYPITDGLGFSLVIVNEHAPWETWSLKSSWRPSGQVHGSPGAADPAPPVFVPVLVNEVLSRPTLPLLDAIELFNPTASPAPIGGWFISDDFATPKKFRIPDGTVIPAHDFMVFEEDDFAGFAFGAGGDEAYLFSADAAGNLTGYHHGFGFGNAAENVSFGRHFISTGAEHFVAQSANTPGGSNAGPRVGPVTIMEIMYHPPDLSGGIDNTAREFIELRNNSASVVSLFDPLYPTNTWHLRGAADFNFPAGFQLAAGESVLLVSFDPTDTTQSNSFRTQYSVPALTRILGPLSTSLDNSSGSVRLLRPDAPDINGVAYILVDEVDYADAAPWPPEADGPGASLQRRSELAYGNDPANWAAAVPTAGRLYGGGSAPAITGHPASLRVSASANIAFVVNATGSAPLSYQWRFNGANLTNATNASLTLTNVQDYQAGLYDVAVFNAAGGALSSNASLSVVYGPFFTLQPSNVSAAPGANVSFSAAAGSISPIRYQWRRNGTDLPGATGTGLNLTNIQPADDGIYTIVATDDVIALESLPARLAVLVPPLIIQPPLSQVVVTGLPVTLSVVVTNTATLPLQFRWRARITTLPGGSQTLTQHTSFLTITNVLSTYTNINVIVTNLTGLSVTSAPALLTFSTDNDRDGIADAWEAQYGFATNSAANRDLDPDGDGLSNWEEYVAGTDPTNGLSALAVVTLLQSNAARVGFNAVSNKTYTLSHSPEPAGGPWSKLADLPATATNRNVSVEDVILATNRFYRLITPQQP